MDVDTSLLRAFVSTAEELHFGRAALRLQISQQALSKRVGVLEKMLGVRLFVRTNRRVALSSAGTNLLPAAREALSSVDAALASVAASAVALTVDVPDEHLAILPMLHQALGRDRELHPQVTIRAPDADIVQGLREGAYDVAFGRAGAITPPWPGDLHRALVMLEPIGLLVSRDDQLAQQDSIPIADLGGVQLWFPRVAAPAEWVEYVDELGAVFGLDVDSSGSTMGFEFFLSRVATGARRATFVGTAMSLPEDERLRTVAITSPVPVFPWWAMWPRRVPDSSVYRLLTAMIGADVPRPAVPDPKRMWLPALDRDYLMADAGG
ncbi:LysR family transcriptional regulator [Nocardia brasiliensis]|uniref:LysR family transcriptional regulator n=1 Tax=Nocardia brasiliensis TaxID=37326 RepID=UPI003D89D5AD